MVLIVMLFCLMNCIGYVVIDKCMSDLKLKIEKISSFIDLPLEESDSEEVDS